MSEKKKEVRKKRETISRFVNQAIEEKLGKEKAEVEQKLEEAYKETLKTH